MKLDTATHNALGMRQSRNFEIAGGKAGRSRHVDAGVTRRRDTPRKAASKLSTFNQTKGQ